MKKKGSMTIEASFLIPCIILVIVMLLYLVFYSYNSITLFKNTCYVGIKVMGEERKGSVYFPEKEWEQISKDTLVISEEESINVKSESDKIIVTGKINFTIPFYKKLTLQEKSVIPECRHKKTVARMVKWKWL